MHSVKERKKRRGFTYPYFVHFSARLVMCAFFAGFTELDALEQLPLGVGCICKVYLRVDQPLAFLAEFIFDTIAV